MRSGDVYYKGRGSFDSAQPIAARFFDEQWRWDQQMSWGVTVVSCSVDGILYARPDFSCTD